MALLFFARISSLFHLILLIGLIVELRATHQVYRSLQSVQNEHGNDQPYRTAYHFQASKNWINDPNGPMVYNGIYHLFYQYNPKGSVWGNIVWAHSTSKDLINWDYQKPAIYPSQKSDINGCWSGSATILPTGKPVIMYTGINLQNEQVQNLAIPKNASDPFLRDWIKYDDNPLMQPTKANQINGSSFRDPTTFWQCPDGRYRVLVGNKRDRMGKALLYRSRLRDIRRWTQAHHSLHSSKVGMWECPDFFPVELHSIRGLETSAVLSSSYVKYVLKASLDDYKHDYYAIGSYNCKKDVFIPDNEKLDIGFGLRYDYGKFYASKTFFDSMKKRRVLLGWCNESSPVSHDMEKGWAGVHVIPRTVHLDVTGKQLVQWPVAEVEKLRGRPIKFRKEVKGGDVVEITGITASQADVEVSYEFKGIDLGNAVEFNPEWTDPAALCSLRDAKASGKLGPFGLLVLASRNITEHTAVFFRVFKNDTRPVVLMCSDQSSSSLDKSNDRTNYGAFLDVKLVGEKMLSMRTLIDHSIVESFGGKGRTCITARVYPKLAIHDEAHLYAFNYGGTSMWIQLEAWSMKKAIIT